MAADFSTLKRRLMSRLIWPVDAVIAAFIVVMLAMCWLIARVVGSGAPMWTGT